MNFCGGKGCKKCAMGWKLDKKFEIVKKLLIFQTTPNVVWL